MNHIPRTAFGLALAALLLLAGAAGACGENPPPLEVQPSPLQLTLYSSPGCGCCSEYEKYLVEQGFRVQSIRTEDMTGTKADLDIPRAMWSCHTVVVMGYFVEGHVPVEAINRLLQQRPSVDGIALPGMPPGSPGMGGVKTGPWTIYQVAHGESSEFMSF
mgnify:CR=1 FL=1